MRKEVFASMIPSPERDQSVLVEFDSVRKTYDGRTLVIRDLNLTLVQGEFLTLLGPSGSGKTTTLMLLAGFELPTEGMIWLNKQPLNNVPPHKRNIGVVFQDYALFPHMTAAENVAYPLRIRRWTKKDVQNKVSQTIEKVQLQGLEKRRTIELSGGQQQRVALARALVFDPQLVLMDEPLGALDRQLREQMQLEIKHLQKDLSFTVVYVTHDQIEALTMSDRIAVFNEGGIEQIGTPASIYEAPENSFVASFIGENNRLNGEICCVVNDYCEVRLDNGNGARVEARRVTVGDIGSRTTLSIRPERIHLYDDETAGDVDSTFVAEIVEAIYVGDEIRLRMRALGQDNISVKVPVTHSQGWTLRPGHVLTAGWKKEDCKALDPV